MGHTPAAQCYGLDGWLTGAAFALLACGLVMVASASVAVAEKSTGVPLYYFYKQFAYALLGRPGADQAKKEWESLPKPDPRWTV